MKLKVESSINGKLKGINGNTIFELTNGQKWQQDEFKYQYVEKYTPEIKIWEAREIHYLSLDDENDLLRVKKIQ